MTNKEMIEPWRQYGVRLEKEDTVDGVTHLYISVPKMSDFFDDNGNELSGALLAKRVKQRSNHIPKTGDDDLSDIFDIFFGYGNKNPFT